MLDLHRVTPAEWHTADPSAKPKCLSQDIDGKSTQLSKYKGKVVLVVNVASEC